jgi:hypothetical protein
MGRWRFWSGGDRSPEVGGPVDATPVVPSGADVVGRRAVNHCAVAMYGAVLREGLAVGENVAYGRFESMTALVESIDTKLVPGATEALIGATVAEGMRSGQLQNGAALERCLFYLDQTLTSRPDGSVRLTASSAGAIAAARGSVKNISGATVDSAMRAVESLPFADDGSLDRLRWAYEKAAAISDSVPLEPEAFSPEDDDALLYAARFAALPHPDYAIGGADPRQRSAGANWAEQMEAAANHVPDDVAGEFHL